MRLISIFFLLFFTSLSVYSQSQAKAFDSVFTYLYKNHQFNGNVLVAEKGKVIFEKSYGYSNMLTKEKLNSESMFELASVSKQFTAMGILMLAKAGRLTLDDSLSKYLPQLPYKGITIKHLLTHTSGLPDYMDLFDKHWNKKEVAHNNDLINLLVTHRPPALFTPGEEYEYSNTGYVLLASIIEKVSGESYGSFLHKKIFAPLKMHRTRVYNTRRSGEKISNYAYGFVFDTTRRVYMLPDSVEATKFVHYLDGITGDGTVNSTTTDLLKWDRALYSDKLLDREMISEAFAPFKLNDGTFSGYGYGWELINDSTGGKGVWHSGGWPGYFTAIYRFIEKDKTLIILRNARRPGRIRMFQEAMLDILFDRRFVVPVIE